MKIIEFTGPPGSGKSTVCRALKEVMARGDVDVCDASDLVLRCGRYPFDRKRWLRLMSLLPRSLFQKCLRGMNNYLYLKHECRIRFLLENLSMFEKVQSRLFSRSMSEDQNRERIGPSGRYGTLSLAFPRYPLIFIFLESFPVMSYLPNIK